ALAFVEQALLQGGHETAEDVARAEVHPDRVLFGGGDDGRTVKGRDLDAQSLPFGLLVQDGCSVHLHNDTHSLLLPFMLGNGRPDTARYTLEHARGVPAPVMLLVYTGFFATKIEEIA